MSQTKWWKSAVVYQIYPLSFCDSNGDGIGDLQGIISKLDYLATLGVDVLWLSPVYQSPMDDNGYDISNYYQIDPVFGTMSDFQQLLYEVHQRKMKLIIDLVVNHTSDEHIWFQEARQSKSNPKRDYYIWRDQPSDIGSVFSGSAWEFDSLTNQYYFHLFSKKQPDLNWDNANLRNEIYTMINFWLDLGIDGFRLDVIDLIGKDIDRKWLCDGPYLLERLNEMHQSCFQGRDVLTVGECPCLSIDRVKEVTSGDDPLLSMVFQFGHMSLDEIPGKGKWDCKPLDLIALKQYFNTMQTQLHNQGWNSLFWSNHDQVRAVSRFGSEEWRYQSQTMLSTLLFGLEGTPYIYQGEELGMTGIKLPQVAQYKDIETLNMANEKRALGWSEEQILQSIYKKGRDNSRTPMQWDDSYQAGFTTGVPWLLVNPNYTTLNAHQDRQSMQSIYRYTQQLIQIRKQYFSLIQGSFNLLYEHDPELFLYERECNSQGLLIIANFGPNVKEILLPVYSKQQRLIQNDQSFAFSQNGVLPPYFAAIYLYTR